VATLNGVGMVGFEVFNLTGTAGNDTIDGSAFTLSGLTLSGNSGDDVLKGGSQYDVLRGGPGSDTLEGNGGGNRIYSSNYYGGGDAVGTINFLRGGSGNDVLFSAEGNDTLEGFGGNDNLVGLGGTDSLNGGDDNDTLSGGDGNDTLTGGGGNDNLFGGNNDDLLIDGPGNNLLSGDAGNDTVRIVGTPGADLLSVDNGTVTINGSVNTYSTIEILTADTAGGIDEGTQIPTTHPLPYTVTNLEPKVSIGEDVFNTDIPFVLNRGGSFKDIGSGQTWSATVDYAEGGGFVPLTLNANKTFTLNHAYSTGGVFNVTVRVVDNQGNVGTDSFLLVRPAGIQVGLVGGAQRSMIDQLTVSLAGNQTLLPGWYTFERTTPGPLPAIAITVSQVGNQTVAFFTFSGSDIIAGSLADGRYKLTLNSQFIRDPQNQQFDGDADNLPGGNFQFSFHRLFGDINGDAQVDGGADFAAFGASFGISSGPDFTRAFDYNGDGTVEGGTDFAEFGARFGLSI